MNKIAFDISSVLLDILKRKFHNDYSCIKDVKMFWHNLNYLLISKVNCKLLSKKQNGIDLNDFETLELIPKSFTAFSNTNSDLIGNCIDDMAEQILACEYKLQLLREYLLSIELCVTKNEIELIQGKVSRDTTGSYYTPYSLAKSIVEKIFSQSTVSAILKERTNKIKIADLSCGGGEFFGAVQEYLNEEYGVSYESSSTFFWGIDVDPIALQITICKLLLRANIADWEEIINHFRVGNPLISTGTEATFERKNELFALNRIYAPEMGMKFSNDDCFEFDIILGNPPWEKIRFEERKFFKGFAPKISELSKKDERKKAISELKENWNELFLWETEISNDYSKICSQKYSHHLIKESVSGELNTYALFTELSYKLLKPTGVSTLIVKNTLATAPAHKKMWSYLLSKGAIESLYFFDNKKKIFNIDSRERFAVISLSRVKVDSFLFATGLELANDILNCSEIVVNANDIKTINPFTNMIPNITSNDDFELLVRAHERLSLFEEVYSNCHFGRLIHLTAHSQQISRQNATDLVPIYEGKFIEQYDARFSTFANMPDSKKYSAKASASKNVEINGVKPIPESRYYVQKQFWGKYTVQYNKEFSLCWRSLTSSTNARTTIAMILPTCPTCQSIQMLQTENNIDLIVLLGLFNSLPFDYFVRLKMPGIDLTQSVIRQIPVPSAVRYEQYAVFNGRNETLITHILSSVYYLIKNEEMLSALAKSINHLIYQIDDQSTNEGIRKTLDKVFAHAYQIDENTYKKIVKSFPRY